MTGSFWWREKIFKDFGHSYKVELVFEEKGLQEIQIFKNPSWGYLFVLDGIVQFTEKDEFIYHETITYLPISLLPTPPEEVIIVGGGDGGVLRELQKIPTLKKIIQFEIDTLVFDLCQKYFFKISGDYADPRVNLVIKDGYLGLKESPSEGFDLVIVDCTDPVGPAKTLYTVEFYQEASRVLKPHGFFIQQASLPIYFPHIIKEAYPKISQVFPYVKIVRCYVPCYGEEIAFFLATKEPKDWFNPKQLISGKYYHPGLNPYYFSLPQTWLELLK
ncbi:spermine synthase [Thermodesulfobacterium thermophilum]|uniref:spermine/spermidine synthase domain-containing protein n=1 Tax=Thermodesulfobacterium thermophilum TaxID=886 RepID=UPI0003B5C55F|nr:spermine synthase [Thermodesulfobacterium thermophilum]